MGPALFLCSRCHGARTEPGNAEAQCRYCCGVGSVTDQPLSPHFMLSELLVSETAARRGLANDPPDGYLERLRMVADELLEPIRRRFGALHVNSGFRSAEVNRAIGGSPTSAHVEGFAADLVPLTTGVTLKQIVDWIVANQDLKFDQVIFEGTWVHVGLFSPSGEQRLQALQMFGGKYSPYDPDDPRVGQ